MKSLRIKKVNELLKRELSNLIFKEIKDPRIKGIITIMEVDTSRDLKNAKIYVSIFGLNENQKKRCLEGIQSSSNFLKFRLSKLLSLRYIPELKFMYDEGLNKGFDIIEKLNNIRKEYEGN